MVDVVSPEARSRMMSGIRGKNTHPEVVVRKLLFASGYRFRLHRKDLPGAPDIVLPSKRIAIFVHGCFWHRHEGCKYATLPKTHPEFWFEKLSGNAARDLRATTELRNMDWRVLTVWECSLKGPSAMANLRPALIDWIEGASLLGEIGAMTKPDSSTQPLGG